jgi:hypothetical protein
MKVDSAARGSPKKFSAFHDRESRHAGEGEGFEPSKTRGRSGTAERDDRLLWASRRAR